MNDIDTMSRFDDIEKLRQDIMSQMPRLNGIEKRHRWWLLSTAGCHLCDVAQALLAHFSAVEPIEYEYIDIANFDESLMMQFATTIPIILTPTQRLNYPFSVLDLQQLLLS